MSEQSLSNHYWRSSGLVETEYSVISPNVQLNGLREKTGFHSIPTVTDYFTPTEIKLHKQSRILEVSFQDGNTFELSCEYLRVYSPSAEVQGHGPGQQVLQYGKERVNVWAIEPVGNYAVVLKFDDGHDTGIYSWELLYELGANKDRYWKSYLDRLQNAGYQRREST